MSGEGSTTLNYSALANTAAERTVYIRVSAIYDKETITSVLAATQDPKTFTVTYNANGGSGTTADDDSPYVYGSEVIAIENAFTPPSGKIFNNWNTQADGEGDSYAVGAQITASITGAIVLYAQWVDEPTYTLIENVSQIVPGAHYIIAGGYTGTVKVMASQNTNNRSSEELTVTSKQIINPAASIYRFVLSGYEENWTFYDGNVSSTGYLYAASSSANNLKTEKPLDANGNGKWSITIGDNGACLIEAQGNNTRNKMRLNGSIFACYGESNYNNYGPIYLFILDDDTDIHPYSPSTYGSGTTTINDDITITTDNAITIANGAKVVFKGNVTSATVSNLVVNDGGQLVVSNSGVKATFKKDIAQTTEKVTDNNHWYAISSPMTITNINEVANLVSSSVSGFKYNLFRYNEANVNWEAYNTSAHPDFTTLANGHGYLYRNNIEGGIEFAGTVNVNNVSINLTASRDDAWNGFNLIGNPFGEDITMDNISGKSFTGGYILTNAGAWNSTLQTTIHPCQGFLVQVDDDETITISKPAVAKGSAYNHEYLQFVVANDEYEDVTYALFDKGHGLNKINHRNAEIPMVYIPQNGQDYAIAMMNDNVKSFNLNFKAATMGQSLNLMLLQFFLTLIKSKSSLRRLPSLSRR